jgi:acyl-CoA synthetase (NDP forming)
VAIVTNAGGPGILCADACEAGGLVLPELSDGVKARLRKFLPASASVTNPVDMIASAGPDHYRRTIETVLAANDIDTLVVIYIPVDRSTMLPMIAAIREGITAGRAAGGIGKPVLACLMAEDGVNAPLELGSETVPSYAFPEAAARVLSKVATHAEWRSRPLGTIPELKDIQSATARDVCRNALHQRGAGWLSAEETRTVLTAMNLPVAPGGLAHTADEAEAIAQSLGFPVAVKLASHRLIHKTEIGGVHLNLMSPSAVREAYEKIRDRLVKDNNLAAMEGVLVQPMFLSGVEVMAGVTHDPLFGPLIAFGLGGIHVEILGDVRFRITPLTDRDAAEMVREIRGYRLLEGYRGHQSADIQALENVLLRISRLVEEVHEIKDLDLNPIFALPPGEGCRIVDARIRVEGA